MAQPKIYIFSFFRFFFFFYQGYTVDFFSLSLLFGLLAHFLYHHLDIPCSLVHTPGFPGSFTLLACIRIYALLSLDLSFAFCTAFVSYLLSHHCPCLYPVLAFFLLCYYIVIVIVSLISVISPLLYDHLTPPWADDSDIRHLRLCSPTHNIP